MSQQELLTTQHLSIGSLTQNDNVFILELVNTKGWIDFIGDRNISTPDDASAYIQKILDNPNVTYWVVRLTDKKTPIGLVTFIKRDYLKHHDIGFAFLPGYAGKGYAYEATLGVMNNLLNDYNSSHILATTVPENTKSIALLKKLGLVFEKEIKVENEKLHVFSVSTDMLSITKVTQSFFNLFTNSNNRKPDFSLMNSLCIPEITLINKTDTLHTVYNITSFIEPRQRILSDGTLTEFEEWETNSQTEIVNGIAQRHSVYSKTGILEGKRFKQSGHKFFQFTKTNSGWKISAVLWVDDTNTMSDEPL